MHSCCRASERAKKQHNNQPSLKRIINTNRNDVVHTAPSQPRYGTSYTVSCALRWGAFVLAFVGAFLIVCNESIDRYVGIVFLAISLFTSKFGDGNMNFESSRQTRPGRMSNIRCEWFQEYRGDTAQAERKNAAPGNVPCICETVPLLVHTAQSTQLQHSPRPQPPCALPLQDSALARPHCSEHAVAT